MSEDVSENVKLPNIVSDPLVPEGVVLLLNDERGVRRVVEIVKENADLRARVAELEAALREIKAHGTNGAGEPWLWAAQVAARALLAAPTTKGGNDV